MRQTVIIRLLLLIVTLCLCPWLLRTDVARRLNEAAGPAPVVAVCSLLVIIALGLFLSACVDHCRELRLVRRVRQLSQNSSTDLSPDLLERFALIDHTCNRCEAILARYASNGGSADWPDRLTSLRRMAVQALATLQYNRHIAAAVVDGTPTKSPDNAMATCDELIARIASECDTSLAVATALPPTLPAPALTTAIQGECARLDQCVAPLRQQLERLVLPTAS